MRLCHQRSRRVVAGTRCDHTARPTTGIVSFNSQLIVVRYNADRTSYEQYIRRRPYILQLGNPCGQQFCRPRPHTVQFGVWLRSAKKPTVTAFAVSSSADRAWTSYNLETVYGQQVCRPRPQTANKVFQWLSCAQRLND